MPLSGACECFDGTLRLSNPPPHLQHYLQTVNYKCSHLSSCPIMFLLKDVPQPLTFMRVKEEGEERGKMCCLIDLVSTLERLA